MTTPFEMMQRAVDIVNSSPHPTNKIAASLSGTEKNGHAFAIAETNFWPSSIEKSFGRDTKIGNSSGTIHAETACILHSPHSKGASVFMTDPPCPNCAKNIAEAGIKDVYIDHKGFEKDFAQRRGAEFQSMSMRIFAAAGIPVYELRRKEQNISPVISIEDNYTPPSETPFTLELLGAAPTQNLFVQMIGKAQADYQKTPFALCFAQDPVSGRYQSLSAAPHPTIGFTHKDDLSKEGKYSFILQPINRLLMSARQLGLKIEPDYIYSKRIPTARELINMIGANYDTLSVGSESESRDEFALLAKTQLENASIFKFLSLL